jgi:hypothetical protein
MAVVPPSGSSAPFRMRLSLSVLDHLGLNLYSNIPAVISEVVANSWDADATTVTIDIDRDSGRITVSDDGIGMSQGDLNDRFLFVGYRRRDNQPTKTAKGRHVMGRKGIGKLSLFAIAKTIQVETAKDGTTSGLVMRADDIRAQMQEKEGEYHPDPLPASEISVAAGTRITLSDLRLNPNAGTVTALRRRLARRFSIIGPDHGFEVTVNGEPIKVSDRDFYPKIEYLWSLGDVGDQYEKLCSKALKKKRLSGTVDAGKGWTVSGWVGTVDTQKSITEETNIIPVLAWGKLIHEDLLAAVKPAGLFAKYVMGELHADFVDDDKADDIATSDRQSLKEDDPRFAALTAYLRDTVLREVGNSWRDWRRDNALDKARENPIIEEWYTSLGPDARKAAKTLFGKIGNMTGDESDRIELYKNGILAFEKLRFRALLSEIDKLDGADQLDLVGRVFSSIDEIEAAQYGEIARGRLRIIESFIGLVDADEKEKVIQKHLFDHLWLLNPSWERASTNQRIEESVMTEFAAIDVGLSNEEKKGRIDIRYRTAAGKNIIIELKRYSVKVKTGELVDQIGKYRSALAKCLQQTFADQPQAIECIAVLGRRPDDFPPETVDRTLAGLNARIITYDELIQHAHESYSDYLQKHTEVSRLSDLISRLEQSATKAAAQPERTETAAPPENADGAPLPEKAEATALHESTEGEAAE